MTESTSSSAVSPAPSASRPRAIRIIAWIMLGIAALGAVQAIAAFAERRTLEAGLIEVGKYMSSEQARYRTGNLHGSVSFALALGITALVAFALLSVFVSRGVRLGRTLTWVASVVMVIGELILMSADSGAVQTGNFVYDVDVPGGTPETVAMLNDMLVPGWFPPLHYGAELLIVAGIITVCVQLARPAAADFFRREPAEVCDDRVWTTDRLRGTT